MVLHHRSPFQWRYLGSKTVIFSLVLSLPLSFTLSLSLLKKQKKQNFTPPLTWHGDAVVQRRRPRHCDIVWVAASHLDVQLSPADGSSQVPQVWHNHQPGRRQSDHPAARRTHRRVRPREGIVVCRIGWRRELRSGSCPNVGNKNIPVTAAGEEDGVTDKLQGGERIRWVGVCRATESPVRPEPG